MDYYEVEGKSLALKYGLPVNLGVLYSQIEQQADKIVYPCIAKAQVLSGKRGKAGGVKIVHHAGELESIVSGIQSLMINGLEVQDVLLDPLSNIENEHYIGFTMDRVTRSVVMLYSPFGGMDIETLAAEMPEKLLKISFCERVAFDTKALIEFAKKQDVADTVIHQLIEIAEKMCDMFFALDATTLEFNPLAEIEGGRLMVLDTKLVIDDNAAFRQKDYTLFSRERTLNHHEKIAAEAGLAYVELEKGGQIGMIAGGAGIGMATVDAIKYYEAVPFNFLDLGGGVTAEKTYMAMKLLMEEPEVKGILVNVFGGANDCQVMAAGICRAVNECSLKKPIVVKSRGFNQEGGWALYDEAHIAQVHYGTTDQAVQKLLDIMRGV